MDALRRVVRKSPTSMGSSSHKKLSEGWQDNREPVTEGVTFYLKYLGSSLVVELPDDETYGNGISALAVHTIVTMAKNIGKKLKKVSLTISPVGIYMTDLVTKEISLNVSVYRISFCTADRFHDKVFAFISRNTTNETMECHAYLCAKKNVAKAVTLTVYNAFKLAEDGWAEKQQTCKAQKEKENHHKVAELSSTGRNSHVTHQVIKPMIHETSSRSMDSTEDPFTDSSAAVESRLKVTPTKQFERSAWQQFSDGEEEDSDDDFSRFAENRGRTCRLPSFGTDLRQEDIDEGVEQYMDGQGSYEAFSRQKSLEDLLNL
ncbi:low density lipoprotein receptor adapter protein 1-B-like [Gigantopelta aegis]|uniref:low density lipoprotein receptor adapter protein 1-B-like n=1 Tax=Gigantopelta aegis TaxID=1735272 RepID=UPI001B88A93D|nr:low density lipoprotein receptor adapter protein 1-B-like [Gigantopelta aegis]